jgi:putative membrane protein
MYGFPTAAALTVLLATTATSAPQTQTHPSPQSRLAPNAAPGSYQRQDSGVLRPDDGAGVKSGAALCQLKREIMIDAVASTAFAATAAQDGTVEVALAGLALRKSGDNQLRHLAEEMVQDYAQSNTALDLIVKCEGLILPFELDAKYNELIGRLDVKSGRAFEEAYLKHIAQKHTVAMAVFESASRSRNPDIAAFALKGLSMLLEHQLLAENLRAAIATKVVGTH